MKKLMMTAFVAVSTMLAANAQTAPATESKSTAEIAFDKETHDFGIVSQNQPATYTFMFKNTGKEPLIITNAQASCGCTTPEWTKEPIMPGKKGYVKATYNAASLGVFNKAITVMSNAKTPTVTLYIKGDVKVPNEVTPVDPKSGKTLN
jgi:archaellum component FlaG (FlaF/FlaG flagellin family)